MNLNLLKELLQHEDLKQLLKQIQERGTRALITVQRDIERIYQVTEQVKRDREHHWWDMFVGKSPSATKVLNVLIHPIIVLLITVVTLTIVHLVFWCKLKNMMGKLQALSAMEIVMRNIS